MAKHVLTQSELIARRTALKGIIRTMDSTLRLMEELGVQPKRTHLIGLERARWELMDVRHMSYRGNTASLLRQD